MIDIKIINFTKHINYVSVTTVVHQLLIQDQNVLKRNLTSYTNKLQYNHDRNLFSMSKSKLIQVFVRAYHLLWDIQSESLTRVFQYRKFESQSQVSLLGIHSTQKILCIP